MTSKIRHFLNLANIDTNSIKHIIKLSHKLKKRDFKKKPLKNKFLSMIFEKPSTRTRISFEIGMKQLGGDVVTLDHADTQLGRGESIEDTVKVLCQYADIILYRGSSELLLNKISLVSSVPIINGLTDNSHPCQIMADIMTLEEKFKTSDKLVISWIGDGNNVCNSWIDISRHYNFTLRVSTPDLFLPNMEKLNAVKALGKDVSYVNDPKQAVKNANVVITDTWSSMGTKDTKKRLTKFSNYQVNNTLMKLTNNNSIFMHCMPAHRGQEVTSQIIDGPKSMVIEEAHNRLHVQKSILLWCMEMDAI